jgi:sugar phosphate isomerase/epimerase
MAYPISIQLHTVRDLIKTPEGYRKTIGEIAQIGYVGIEAGIPSFMKPDEFVKFLADLGIVVTATWGMPKAENVQQFVETAKLLNIRHICGCYGPDQVKNLAEVTKTAADFEKAAQVLKPHGLEMLFHNHAWEFNKIEDGRYAWDALMELAPTLKCQIDTYWASNFGAVDVPAVIRKYRHRTPILHIKDGPLVKDQPNTAVGRGKLDNVACIKAADPAVTKYLVVEMDACATDTMTAVRESYEYLVGTGLARGRR